MKAAQPQQYSPMTLGNMRQLGVTRLAAYCHAPYCWHQATVDARAYADAVAIPELARRFRCSVCGSRNVDVRPDWTQQQRPGMGGEHR